MHIKVSILFISATVVLASSVLSQDDHCRDILVDGIRNKYSIQEYVKQKAEIERILSSSDDELRKAKQERDAHGGGSITIPIEGLPVEFGGGGGSREQQDEIKRIRKRFKDDSSSHVSDEEMRNITIAVVDPGVVKAWSDCMSHNHPPDTFLESGITPGAEFVTLHLKWTRPILLPTDRIDVKITSLAVAGLEYDGDIAIVKGTSVGLGGVSQLFRRLNPGKQAVIVVNSEGGTVTKVIDPATPALPPAVERPGEVGFYREFARNTRNAAATQGVYRDRITLIWRPYHLTFRTSGFDYLRITAREARRLRLHGAAMPPRGLAGAINGEVRRSSLRARSWREP